MILVCYDQKSWLSKNLQVDSYDDHYCCIIIIVPVLINDISIARWSLIVIFSFQVEDGREGGNQEFEDGISDQYEDEVR